MEIKFWIPLFFRTACGGKQKAHCKGGKLEFRTFGPYSSSMQKNSKKVPIVSCGICYHRGVFALELSEEISLILVVWANC